jgi:phosphoribosyl-dephospho-CoA transferase
VTLEELLECDADKLQAMPDDVLKKHFEQYLCVTRPELAPKPTTHNAPIKEYVSPKKAALIKLLEEGGIDYWKAKKKK